MIKKKKKKIRLKMYLKIIRWLVSTSEYNLIWIQIKISI